MSTFVHETKLQGEVFTLRVDFLSRLDVTETLETCIATIEVLAGEDENPTEMLLGDAEVYGATHVQQRIQGGVVGVTYQISLAGRTSTNNIYINQCKLVILPSPDMTVPELP